MTKTCHYDNLLNITLYILKTHFSRFDSQHGQKCTQNFGHETELPDRFPLKYARNSCSISIKRMCIFSHRPLPFVAFSIFFLMIIKFLLLASLFHCSPLFCFIVMLSVRFHVRYLLWMNNRSSELRGLIKNMKYSRIGGGEVEAQLFAFSERLNFCRNRFTWHFHSVT